VLAVPVRQPVKPAVLVVPVPVKKPAVPVLVKKPAVPVLPVPVVSVPIYTNCCNTCTICSDNSL
jgi:hypothetical protein